MSETMNYPSWDYGRHNNRGRRGRDHRDNCGRGADIGADISAAIALIVVLVHIWKPLVRST